MDKVIAQHKMAAHPAAIDRFDCVAPQPNAATRVV